MLSDRLGSVRLRSCISTTGGTTATATSRLHPATEARFADMATTPRVKTHPPTIADLIASILMMHPLYRPVTVGAVLNSTASTCPGGGRLMWQPGGAMSGADE